jgi:ferritin-like metal-binding protein YciE
MNALQEQLTKYLTDAHSIEQQALAQMRAAPELAARPQIADAFAAHLGETERHEQLVRERLESREASPAPVKDLLGTLTGKGFVAFARSQPDTTGKLVVHGFSYEHMELAAYEMIELAANRAGDAESAETARTIAAQEDSMSERLRGCFDLAVDAALDETEGRDAGEALEDYLSDAHAIEAQSLGLLGKAPKLAGDSELAEVYAAHRAETERQQARVEERLRERGGSPSRLKDAALRLGALNWGAFFAAQPGDTPAKLTAFAYAFEHLEIAAYELLGRVAARAGDSETERLAQEIVAEEQAAARRLRSMFERSLELSLPAAR